MCREGLGRALPALASTVLQLSAQGLCVLGPGLTWANSCLSLISQWSVFLSMTEGVLSCPLPGMQNKGDQVEVFSASPIAGTQALWAVLQLHAYLGTLWGAEILKEGAGLQQPQCFMLWQVPVSAGSGCCLRSV